MQVIVHSAVRENDVYGAFLCQRENGAILHFPVRGRESDFFMVHLYVGMRMTVVVYFSVSEKNGNCCALGSRIKHWPVLRSSLGNSSVSLKPRCISGSRSVPGKRARCFGCRLQCPSFGAETRPDYTPRPAPCLLSGCPPPSPCLLGDASGLYGRAHSPSCFSAPQLTCCDSCGMVGSQGCLAGTVTQARGTPGTARTETSLWVWLTEEGEHERGLQMCPAERGHGLVQMCAPSSAPG